MKLRILDVARDDLIGGAGFYDAQGAGLGDYFLACLYSDIESLKLFGGMHPIAYGRFHRALSSRFPFAIYYTLEEDVVVVRSIVDCRRNPSWIRTHTKDAQQ